MVAQDSRPNVTEGGAGTRYLAFYVHWGKIECGEATGVCHNHEGAQRRPGRDDHRRHVGGVEIPHQPHPLVQGDGLTARRVAQRLPAQRVKLVSASVEAQAELEGFTDGTGTRGEPGVTQGLVSKHLRAEQNPVGGRVVMPRQQLREGEPHRRICRQLGRGSRGGAGQLRISDEACIRQAANMDGEGRVWHGCSRSGDEELPAQVVVPLGSSLLNTVIRFYGKTVLRFLWCMDSCFWSAGDGVESW